MNAKSLSKRRAAEARSQFNQRQIVRQQRSDRAQTARATYQGYDADSGLHRYELPDGGMVTSSAATNAGLAAGDRVSVSRAYGARYGAIGAVPH